MIRQIILKHYIDRRENLDAYLNKIPEIRKARELSQGGKNEVRVGLKLTVDEGLPEELSEELRASLHKIPRDSFVIVNPHRTGGGNGFKQIMFNQAFSDKPANLVYMVGLDQFPIDTEEALGLLNELGDKVERDNALYALGSRDVPVVLGMHLINSRRRIIHELFNTLAAPEGAYRVPNPPANVTPAYAAIGECTTGVSIMNHAHRSYPEMLKQMAIATQNANMTGNAADYYLAIRAPQLARIVTGYVRSIENPFHGKQSQEQEWLGSRKMIVTQTAELGKTDVRDMLYQALINPSNTARLSEFYPKQEVVEVKDLMLEAMVGL